MKNEPRLFTPESSYAVIRVMFQAVGLDIKSRVIEPGEHICCLHEHVNLTVGRPSKEENPFLLFHTKNENNYLLILMFDDADTILHICQREKRATGTLASDLSMFNAMALYLQMRQSANAYIQNTMRVFTQEEALAAICSR